MYTPNSIITTLKGLKVVWLSTAGDNLGIFFINFVKISNKFNDIGGSWFFMCLSTVELTRLPC